MPKINHNQIPPKNVLTPLIFSLSLYLSNSQYLHEQNIFYIHDDVIKWKHFQRYWPLWRESTGHRWIPLTEASDTEI